MARSTARSASCTFHEQANTNRCVHCSICTEVHYENDLTDRNKDSTKEVKLKCPLTSL